ncbi:MAG: hypothetical protein ABSA04_00300 [Desulfobaccales bacterium]
MKKILIFAVVLALLVPAAALADTEFSLGGYIKLDSYWDSTQQGKNINGAVARDNDQSFHHGNLRFTAQGSRFNFTIKGPEVLGAKLTGFIEMDFDSCTDVGSISALSSNAAPTNAGSQSASNNYIPRLRHAMFRLNWPCDTELLFGQYWSMFCDWFPEVAEDGPFQVTGIPTARLPQIRLTQGFAGDWKVAGLIGLANSATATTGLLNGNPYGITTTSGGDAETPQIQGQLKYAHDWWGKAAFFGNPIPFTASITAGWQRNIQRYGVINPVGLNWVGYNGWMANTYLNPWMIQGSLFIPVIPTYTKDLTGTAHLLIQPWIGQGTNEFGMAGDGTGVFKFNYMGRGGVADVSEELLHRFGAMLEGQYYFTNQWFLNAAYGVSAAFDVNQSHVATGFYPQYAYNNPLGQSRMNQQVDATLWYQPIKALKFGLQYSFMQTKWVSDAYPNANGAAGPTLVQANGRPSDLGHEHRIEFAGFFFF